MVKRTEKHIKGVTGFFAFFLLMIVLFVEMGSLQCQAANKYGTFVGKKPDTYTISGNTVYFFPKKIYYSGKKVICYVYVVNKTGEKIVGLSDVTLAIRDKKRKVIAKHTFGKKQKIKIAADKYKTVKYVFPKKSISKKKFYFGKADKMSIRASFVYYKQ